MRSYEEALSQIIALTNDMAEKERSYNQWKRRDLNAADKKNKLFMLEHELRHIEEERMGVLKDLVHFPPHHGRHNEALEKFNKESMIPDRLRVFIITKYPDSADPKLDEQLRTVINTVKKAVNEAGYRPLLAADFKLHDNLWDNIECLMLACPRGIAIVEDRFNANLNPNVAMEWGWMRAMKKPVLFLVEKAVPTTQSPADVMGLIKGQFDWNNPEADIPRLVAEYLPTFDGF
jgi:hypothetical protein